MNFHRKKPVELTVSLSQESITPDLLALIPDTIRRHFSFRLNDLDHEKRLSLSEGEISIIIAAFNGSSRSSSSCSWIRTSITPSSFFSEA